MIICWTAVSDVVPLYPLYPLLFADSGLSEAAISALFALWSMTGLLTDVPLGALADRLSRRAALVAATVTSVAGLGTELGTLLVYAVWPWDGVVGIAGFGLAATLMLPYALGRHASRR